MHFYRDVIFRINTYLRVISLKIKNSSKEPLLIILRQKSHYKLFINPIINYSTPKEPLLINFIINYSLFFNKKQT